MELKFYGIFAIVIIGLVIFVVLGYFSNGNSNEYVSPLFNEVPFFNEVHFCEGINDSVEKNYCYVAINNSNATPCGMISDSITRDNCYKLVDINGGVSLCKMNSRGHSDLFPCYMNINFNTNDTALCRKMTEFHATSACYANIAIATNNPTFCKNGMYEIGYNAYQKDRCYMFVAINTNNFDLCEKVRDFHLMDLCYSSFAISTNDSVLCGSIDGDFVRELCYSSIAINTNNPALCENIGRGGSVLCQVVDDCYYNIAINTNNPALCENINGYCNKKSDCQYITQIR